MKYLFTITIVGLLLFSCQSLNSEISETDKDTIKAEKIKQITTKKESIKQISLENTGNSSIAGITLSGNEPFWNITLEKEGISHKELGISIKFLPYQNITATENGWQINASEADIRIELHIDKIHSYDDMSGHVYPYTSKVILHTAGDSDKIFQGTGKDKDMKPLAPHPEKNIKFNMHDLAFKDVCVMLDNIKFALMTDKPESITEYIFFPLKINKPGNNIKITDKQEFINQYSTIFTTKLKEKILTIDYNTIDDNSQGIFPDGGAVWITEKDGKAKLFVINAR